MGRILIAGGTDGIGLGFVKRWSQTHQDELFVVGRNFSKIDDLFGQRNEVRLNRLRLDIRDLDAVESAVSRIGDIDIFVNTIGTFLNKPVSENRRLDIESHFQLMTKSQ